MNDFEKKLFADLQAGNSVEAILTEFQKHLDIAKQEHDELEAKKKAEAEAKAKAAKAKAAEAKAKAQNAENARIKKITDLANRLFNGKPTADDVAYMFQRYFATKWNKSEDIIEQVMTATEIDHMVDMAAKMFNDLEPLMAAIGINWEDAARDIRTGGGVFSGSASVSVPGKKKDKSDDDIIRDYIEKLM